MIIGIIPAGGKATRMGGVRKMLLPTPRGVLMDVLMERMEAAGVEEIVVGANHERECLMERYGSRARFPFWHSDTMSEMVMRAANPYKEEKPSAIFGMPDTFFEDEGAFRKLLIALDFGADVAVGIFKTRPEQRHKLGMCRLHEHNPFQVVEVIDKPEDTDLVHAWGVLAWQPVFWQYIQADDPHVGYALPRAINAGLDVTAVWMRGGYWDCGTPDEFFALINHLTSERVRLGA